jgi:hypothetical protein
MNKNKSGWVIGAIVVVLLIALFILSRFTNPKSVLAKQWNEAGIECINEATARLQTHIHPLLRISVDGVNELVPAELGIIPNCTAELHTHDGNGTIHLESTRPNASFMLKDFFTVWGKTIDREGYDLMMIVDGTPNMELGELVMKDHQEIQLSYAKRPASAETTDGQAGDQ